MLKSYALRTSLIMDKFFATVGENNDYIVIKTPQRPDYFWGNYIIMKSPPTHGDYEEWISIFEREIGSSMGMNWVMSPLESILLMEMIVLSKSLKKMVLTFRFLRSYLLKIL